MISIIVPVYNVEKYLDECLQSIHCQTFQDWECILINDGSSDNSASICDNWTKKNKQFKVIHQRNQGVSIARNNGIEEAKGEYITFIDSDDWIDDDYLESLNLALISTDSDLIVSGLKQNHTNGRVLVFHPSSNEYFELNKNNLSKIIDLNKKYLLYGPTSKLYKKDIIHKYQLKFPKSLSYGEDLLFNYQYLEHVNTISCIDKAFYHYRIIGSGTLSSKLRYDQFDVDYTQWNILKSFYQKKDLWYAEAKDLLYNRLWGIIYDSLFLYPRLRGVNQEYIKHILSIPEIKELKKHQHIYPCKQWIKWAILHRLSFLFYLYFKITK